MPPPQRTAYFSSARRPGRRLAGVDDARLGAARPPRRRRGVERGDAAEAAQEVERDALRCRAARARCQRPMRATVAAGDTSAVAVTSGAKLDRPDRAHERGFGHSQAGDHARLAGGDHACAWRPAGIVASVVMSPARRVLGQRIGDGRRRRAASAGRRRRRTSSA